MNFEKCSPIVGQIEKSSADDLAKSMLTESRAGAPQISSNISSNQKRQFIDLVTRWRLSNLLPPSHFLTVNMTKSPVLRPMLAHSPASKVREPLLSAIGSLYDRAGLSWAWACVWVMEVRNGKHFHALLTVPPSRVLRCRLGKLLRRRTGMTVDNSDPWDGLEKEDTGAPVCVVPITSSKHYHGECGLDGLIIYMSKSIDKNASSPVVRRRLGRLVGASGLVQALRQGWRISAFDKRAA